MRNQQLTEIFAAVQQGTIDTQTALKQIALLHQAQKSLIPGAIATGATSNGTTPDPGAGPSRPEIYVHDEPYLRDHTFQGEQVLVGVTHAALAINAFYAQQPAAAVQLHRLHFLEPIVVKAGEQVAVKVALTPDDPAFDFRVLYRYDGQDEWKATATGRLQSTTHGQQQIDLAHLRRQLPEVQVREQLYQANVPLTLGATFQTLTALYADAQQSLAQVVLPTAVLTGAHSYHLHPLLLNSAFVAIMPQLRQVNPHDCYLPFGINELIYQPATLASCWIQAQLTHTSAEMVTFAAQLMQDDGAVVATMTGCTLKRLRTAELTVTTTPASHANMPYVAPRVYTNQAESDLPQKIQDYLTAKLASVIQAPADLSDPEKNLMDAGLTSLQLTSLTTAIERETGIALYPTVFFEYPNLKELIQFFSEMHEETLRAFFADAPATPPPLERGESVATATSTAPSLTGQRWDKAVPDSNTTYRATQDEIAVIGMHGLFAGSSTLGEFWANLYQQKDLISEIPPNRFDLPRWYNPDSAAQDAIYCKWGSFIDDVDQFDAGFFNISPHEADWMDPQLRLLLQSLYATSEDAGYASRLRGSNTGIFVGVCFRDYADKISELGLAMDPYNGTGNSYAVLANRASFFFDLTGPSLPIDTACSSSLFALHAACTALKQGECTMAFVAGVNLILSPFRYRYFCTIGALSRSGRCHTFDAAADGYVPGEAIVSVLLKPRRQAEQDGDRIYALVKGSAALHGGYTPSLTAPSVNGEANVIIKAWENAGIDPATLTYIEAHGTGTPLGDPIEINALQKAFRHDTDRQQFCAIGSAKAHIGHTEGTAGLAGVVKVILQMQQRQIPAMPAFQEPNPYLDLAHSPLYINREAIPWASDDLPRRAGVSSFGFSGSYAHVVLEEYRPPASAADPTALPAVETQTPVLIPLSAKSQESLHRLAENLLAWLTTPAPPYPSFKGRYFLNRKFDKKD